MKERRLRRLFIPLDDLLRVLHGRQVLRIDGLPPNAEIFGFWSDHALNGWSVLVRHSSFSPVPEGEEIPLLTEGGRTLRGTLRLGHRKELPYMIKTDSDESEFVLRLCEALLSERYLSEHGDESVADKWASATDTVEDCLSDLPESLGSWWESFKNSIDAKMRY